MAWQLLTKYSTDAAVKALVDKYDFYIMPIVNPDGMSYAQTREIRVSKFNARLRVYTNQ
jgi:murein tripeptide amidase MpaA